MRKLIRDFSNANGFSTLAEGGLPKGESARGLYLYSFKKKDKSYIHITNALNIACYDVGVHSNVSAVTARALGEQLRQVLRSMPSAEITPESACRSD